MTFSKSVTLGLCAAVFASKASASLSVADAYETVVTKCGTVLKWTPACNKEFLLYTGFSKSVSTVDFDGETLLALRKEDSAVLKLSEESEFKLWDAVYDGLHAAIIAGVGKARDGSTTDLYELRGRDRAAFSRASFFFTMFPRTATLWYYYQTENGNNNPLLVFDTHHDRTSFSWTWWLLFPEKMVADHFYTFHDTNYWRAIAILLSSYIQGLALWVVFIAKINERNSSLLKLRATEYVSSVVLYVVYCLLWYIVPAAICDFFFYVEPVMLAIPFIVGALGGVAVMGAAVGAAAVLESGGGRLKYH